MLSMDGVQVTSIRLSTALAFTAPGIVGALVSALAELDTLELVLLLTLELEEVAPDGAP